METCYREDCWNQDLTFKANASLFYPLKESSNPDNYNCP